MFFFKPKKYISCDRLEHGLHIDYDGLLYCCFFSHSDANYLPVAKICSDFKKSFKMLINTRKKDLKKISSGEIPLRCRGCSQLKIKDWVSNNKIKYLSFTANKRCNANCIYCTTHLNKKFWNSIPDIRIYDTLLDLVNKNKIDNNCDIHIGGGEPTLHCEFPKIIDLFVDRLNATMKIYSSGIIYSDAILKALKSNRCILSISLDSGNKELYKKIKNVDKFDEVVQNISKYCNSLEIKERELFVEMKYVILPDINDSEEYVLEFLNLVKKLGGPSVRCDINWDWLKQYKTDVKKRTNLFKIMKFMEVQSKNMNLPFCFYAEPQALIEAYKQEYDEIILDI